MHIWILKAILFRVVCIWYVFDYNMAFLSSIGVLRPDFCSMFLFSTFQKTLVYTRVTLAQWPWIRQGSRQPQTNHTSPRPYPQRTFVALKFGPKSQMNIGADAASIKIRFPFVSSFRPPIPVDDNSADTAPKQLGSSPKWTNKLCSIQI